MLIVLQLLLIFEFFKNRKTLDPSYWKEKILHSTAFVIVLIILGLIQTSYLTESWHFIEKWSSFILVPIIFLGLTTEGLKTIKDMFIRGIFYGSICSIGILLIINFTEYYSNRSGINEILGIFNYYNTSNYFTKPLDIHPTYLGIYYLTALLYVPHILKNRSLQIASYILFIIAFLFLNSRILFLIGIVVALYFGYKKLKHWILHHNYIRIVLLIFLSATIIGFAIRTLNSSYIGYKFKNIFDFELSMEKEENMNSAKKGNPRMARWISALKLIETKPFTGYGLADEYQNLQRQFELDGLNNAAEARYNSHNQFLGFTIRFGLIGLIFLLGYFILNLILYAKAGDEQYLIVLISILSICMIENFLDRNYGITFSSVLLTLFSYISINRKNALKVKNP